MTTLLEISNLTKSFGPVKAVDDLSLAVEAGEIFGLLGPNGAGKTTTLSMVCGLLKPDSGQIRLNGREHGAALKGRAADSRSRIGVCPQATLIWDRLTCLESLEFIGQMYDVPRSEARRRGLDLLGALGLQEKQNRLAGTLSGGMQRRLNLALALVHDPDLLVLDEPEAGLDPQSRVMVREYIQAWARERAGRTVILTTHNMDEADRLVDRLGIIDRGRLLVLDEPEALKRQFGQGDVIELRLPGPYPQGCLAELGLPDGAVRVCGEQQLEIHCADAVRLLPALLDLLRQMNLPPVEVRLRENTLEDVFIALTGRTLRE